MVEAYAAHPVCSPTRASILTGRYPARLHLTAFIPGVESGKHWKSEAVKGNMNQKPSAFDEMRRFEWGKYADRLTVQ
jgi:hypothetical protein